MKNELITVASTDKIVDAHLIKTKLLSEGIDCFVHDEFLIGLDMLYSYALGGIKVKVPTSQQQQALVVIKKMQTAKIIKENGDALHCPKCDSSLVYNNCSTVFHLGGLLVLLFSMLIKIYPFYIKHKYRCKECKTSF